MIDPLSAHTSQSSVHSLVQDEIRSAMADDHRGYLDIEIHGDWGFPDPRRSPAIVVSTWRRPVDPPPPLAGTQRYRVPDARGEATGTFRMGTVSTNDDPTASHSQIAAPPASGVRVAIERLPPASASPPDVVTVYLPDARATEQSSAESQSSGVPIRFKREPSRAGGVSDAWVFEGLLWIDRDFIADTDTHDHLREWLCSQLGPRCEQVSVLHTRGPFATVRVNVVAPTQPVSRFASAVR